MKIQQKIKRIIRELVTKSIPEIRLLDYLHGHGNEYNLHSWSDDCTIGENVLLYPLYHISASTIGDYTYIAQNSFISLTTIGKFCSIGPNLVCGWGIHPTNGISTAPMFYSTRNQNGVSLSPIGKVDERKEITIGNDVYIGANVTILDGVAIGDGAVIGAGAVVSKDIPPYAIAVGCPIRIIKYRFQSEQIDNLLKIKWWDFPKDKLMDVERFFFDIDGFINNHED